MSDPTPLIDRPLDNTALTEYMTCPRKFFYGMVKHRRRGGPPSPAIAYGSAWHKALEVRYKTGDNDMAVFAAEQCWEDHGQPDDHRTIARLRNEYEAYCERWGETPEDEEKLGHGRTLGYPDNPLVECSLNAVGEGEDMLHPYAGKIDRIIEKNGLLYVQDHKTTSRFDKYYWRQYEINNQMMGYVWLAGLVTGRQIAGVQINLHVLHKHDSVFEREYFLYHPDRIEEWLVNYREWCKRVEDSYRTGDWPMNMSACQTKFGMCQYADICSLRPNVRERFLESEFEENPWNPLYAEEDV